MKHTFNGWENIESFDLNKVVDLVLTNGTPKSIKPDMWIPPMIGDIEQSLSILDFGCGVGRNIFEYSRKYKNWIFYGYDNSQMLDKANEYSSTVFNKQSHEYSNIQFIPDWEMLKHIQFDCIYATIVFQHITENNLIKYLNDIKNMTSKLIVAGRRFNDDINIDGTYKNTWKIMENCGFYPSNAAEINYNVDGNPEDHNTCIYEW